MVMCKHTKPHLCFVCSSPKIVLLPYFTGTKEVRNYTRVLILFRLRVDLRTNLPMGPYTTRLRQSHRQSRIDRRQGQGRGPKEKLRVISSRCVLPFGPCGKDISQRRCWIGMTWSISCGFPEDPAKVFGQGADWICIGLDYSH